MMKKNSFEVGNIVAAIEDDIEGTVTAISELVTIQTKEGFLLSYKPEELVYIPKKKILNNLDVSKLSLQKMLMEKQSVIQLKSSQRNKKLQDHRVLEIDLHIEKLKTNWHGMSNYDILNLQIETAKFHIEFAIRKRIPKLIFIHGVGEGVLKLELHYLLKRYDNLKFYDANYQKYGEGATEVYFFQNPKRK